MASAERRKNLDRSPPVAPAASKVELLARAVDVLQQRMLLWGFSALGWMTEPVQKNFIHLLGELIYALIIL